MSTSKPLVVQTEHLDEGAAAWLGERCELVRCSSGDKRFLELLERAEGLVIRTYTLVNRAFLEGAPRLKVIGRAGVGLDNVDVAACQERGIKVFNTPDANTTAVVEYVVGLMLDATRPRLFLQSAVEMERWKELRQELKARRQLRQLTLGIWGLGRIGKRLARVAGALDMRVIYHDVLEIAPEERWGAEPVGREELCERADVLSVHVDGRASNRGLVGTDALGRCKSDVIFINTSRGFVVDNHALADFMLGHPAACAMLDVHDPEPFDGTYPLLEIDNVHLAPHIASATVLANENMSWVVKDVWRVLSGEA
ncbi:MAG: hypothetical protein LW650_13115 [Planctomycetaceae bacterium]|jgi:phosphoglycerate dehydrogenase-like enzyme|nr:phosphoglycerate dehydrogenase [Phycisphaerales bacterium]MCE2654350.1 hypothetical protein [Planctomycetaceae bacterium]